MIGCGLIARAHGLAAQRTAKSAEFTCCSSRSIDSAKAFAKEFNCVGFYDDHRQMLDEESVDGVVIAAPPQVHLQLINDCLNAGAKFILCEKPLTMTAAEARAVATAASDADAVVLEGFMYRHHPQIAVIEQTVNSGELGRIDQAYCSVNMLDPSELGHEPMPTNWRRHASEGGGVPHDFLCYPIDLANKLMQAEPARAFMRSFSSPTHGTTYRVFGLIEYADGAVANIAASRLTDFGQPFHIGGPRGSLSLDPAFNPTGNSEITVRHSEGLIATNLERVLVEVPAPVSPRLIDLPVFTWQLEHFIDVICGGCEPIMSMDESIMNARVRDALIESSATETWQELA